jgi:hypothetical protein
VYDPNISATGLPRKLESRTLSPVRLRALSITSISKSGASSPGCGTRAWRFACTSRIASNCYSLITDISSQDCLRSSGVIFTSVICRKFPYLRFFIMNYCANRINITDTATNWIICIVTLTRCTILNLASFFSSRAEFAIGTSTRAAKRKTAATASIVPISMP